MLNDLRAVLGWLDARLRLRWALLVPVMCVAALMEAAGAVGVFGLLRLVVEPHRVRTTPFVSEIWQAWPSDDPPAVVAALTMILGVFYVARALYLAWADWLKQATIAKSMSRAGEVLFSRYLAAEYPFHLRRRSSVLIHEVLRSTDFAFLLLVAPALGIIAETVTIAALVTVVGLTTPPQALAAVAVVLALATIPWIFTRRLWMRVGERQRSLDEEQYHVLHQSLGAIKAVKIGGREAFFESRLRAGRRALMRVRQRREWLGTALRLSIETILILSLLAMVLIVTSRGASGADTISLLALFAYTGFRVVPSANRIMLFAGFMREARAYVKGTVADFKALEAPGRPHAVESAIDFAIALVCEDVSFKYDDDGIPALDHINLTLRPGESLGVVGPTGSGKSTLVDVLLGLLQPTSGRVLIDGQDLRGRERAWQRLLGYVPQDPYVLNETVRRNIAFGVPDTSIDEHRLSRAASLARLDEVIRQLPQGFDTMLGESGVRLSGGQRQRVAIARALYSDPAVLVFDEATAALDNQTEREVTTAISSLHGTRTLIVIAHRLSMVQGCDRLIFLQQGRIAAVGTFEELLGNPAFRSMAAV